MVTIPLFTVGLPLSMTCRAIPYGVGLPEWDRQQPFANTVERPGYRRACRYDVRDPDGIPPEAYLTPQKAEELHDCIVLGPKPLSHHAGSIRRASNPRPETQPPLILLCQLGRYPLWHAHKFTQEQLLGRFEPEPVADLAMDLRQ